MIPPHASCISYVSDCVCLQLFAGDVIFQQTIGIPMGTNCALTQSFNFTYRYIDEVLSLSNTDVDKYIHTIYPLELDIKNSTDSIKSSSYLDLLLSMDSNQIAH